MNSDVTSRIRCQLLLLAAASMLCATTVTSAAQPRPILLGRQSTGGSTDAVIGSAPDESKDALTLPGSNSSALISSRRLAQYGRPIPIDSSAVLLYISDVEGGASSPCAQMVNKIKGYGGRAVNFVITAYYADWNNDNVMDKLGFRESRTKPQFTPYTWDAAYRFANGLKACMKLAADNNLYIIVHPHLDDGINHGTWRNALIFDPLKAYGALSYWQAVIKPTVEAIRDVNWRQKGVYFAMQAEMGATLFSFPGNYTKMANEMKKVAGGRWMKVGLSTNWEKVSGLPTALMHQSGYFEKLKGDWENVKKLINIKAVQTMYKMVDWIGVSAYAGLPQGLAVNDLETSCRSVDRELALYGLSLNRLGKEIVLSEYGLGGGMSGDYQTPASSSTNVAASPYWGVDGAYQSWRDPWNRADNRKWMRRFYEETIKFAKQGGGPNYKISAIYLWNIISYDVLGIHYSSSSSQGTYRDTYVAHIITNYNTGLRGRH